MANLRDIKRRIGSVKSTQKITRAMKMVAASRLRRAQEGIVKARPYAYHMRTLVNSVALRAEPDAHPLLRAGGGGAVGIVLITSDRGLCGSYNSSLVNALVRHLRSTFVGREVHLTVVGRKGADTLRRRQIEVRKSFTGIADLPRMKAATQIIGDLVDQYAGGELDEVYCLYNEFKSAVQQTVTLEKMLPFETPDEAPEGGRAVDYLYEPSAEAILGELLVRNMRVQMHRILHESAASEYGARMTAMDAATRNAGEMIKSLTLAYNRARQDAITKELIEVISGAEAL